MSIRLKWLNRLKYQFLLHSILYSDSDCQLQTIGHGTPYKWALDSGLDWTGVNLIRSFRRQSEFGVVSRERMELAVPSFQLVVRCLVRYSTNTAHDELSPLLSFRRRGPGHFHVVLLLLLKELSGPSLGLIVTQGFLSSPSPSEPILSSL
jgi:hypothetical protein